MRKAVNSTTGTITSAASSTAASTSNSREDFADAIDSLTQSINALEKRLIDVETEISSQKGDRRAFINAEVTRLIPDASENSLYHLTSEYPEFCSEHVLGIFHSLRNVFFFFKPSGYQEGLLQLQTKFAQYLDGSQCEQLRAIDTALAELIVQRDDYESTKAKTSETLRLVEACRSKKARLTTDIQMQVRKMADAGRSLKRGERPVPSSVLRPSFSATRSPQYRPSTLTTSSDDDTDLWIYFATDIPTSFRTLLFEALDNRPQNDMFREPMHGHVGTFDGGGASVSYDASAEQEAISSNSNSAAYLSVAIAVDDSLGVFS
jgi:hypothetical protein